MGIRKFYIDVIENRTRGLKAAFLKLLLILPSLIYWLVVRVRNFLYDNTIILRQYRFKTGVISVGNLTWGGTGKTSLAIALCSLFSSKGVALLTRGYGQDEIRLLEKSLHDISARAFAGRDRVKILKELDPRFNLAILDDGFQYRRLKRDVDILLFNGNAPFGNGHLLPLGSLREPKSSIRRAHIALIMHRARPDLAQFLESINPRIKVFQGFYEPKALTDMQGTIIAKEELLNNPLASFCAIGYPEGFLNLLEKGNLTTKIDFVYPDHYELSQEEFRKIEARCSSLGIKHLIITAKDRSRFVFPTELSIVTFEVALRIDDRDDFLRIIEERLS